MLKWPACYDLLKQTVREYGQDRVPQLGAALAFYSMLSIGPLLLLALSAAGLVFDHEVAQGKLVDEIRILVGRDGAAAIQDMLQSAVRNEEAGIVATILGLATLLIGASGVFGQLQDAMNIIWNVEPKQHSGVWDIIKARFLSFSMVLGTSFLLLVSLIISTALAAMGSYSSGFFSGLAVFLPFMDFMINFGVVTLLFALVFKLIPDVKVEWDDVWVGAVLTALLFIIGKSAIGLYLGRSGFSTSYGAAGSLVVILVWVYYSSQILFFGAEFTQVYAKRKRLRN